MEIRDFKFFHGNPGHRGIKLINIHILTKNLVKLVQTELGTTGSWYPFFGNISLLFKVSRKTALKKHSFREFNLIRDRYINANFIL